MADIFVSYKRENRAHAQRIADRLKAKGFSVWWDDDITPRDAWDATIEREIAAATGVLVLWSPASIESEWVRNEAHFGHQRGKLAPVIVERCEPPLAFRLVQTVDLCGWDGDDSHRPWCKLLIWLADLKASARAPGAPGPAPANPFRDAIGRLSSGEPIVDGAFVNVATPAGTLFRDGEGAPVMRIVPRGEFLLGAGPDDPDRTNVEGPQKRIDLTRPIAVGVYPVTNAEYARHGPPRAAVQAAPAKTGGWFGRKPALPPAAAPVHAPDAAAGSLSFQDALDLAARLSQAVGAAYRLPSETEWEYACRAGSRSRYSWGDAIDPSRALYMSGGAGPSGPAAPGRFPANAFGLYDMHGNVREWVKDVWRESYDLTPTNGLPATDGHSAMRVTRGGGWPDPPSMLRSSARGRATETIRSDAIGVRLVRDLD
jgi:formylglycine-generating enzyme required for sulfatase activity